MGILRTHACMKKIAFLSNLASKKASGSRLFCVESGRRDDFDEVLGIGKRFAAVWGNGDFGRLGLGNLESKWRPKPISPSAFGDQSLKEVACGGAHTLFLTGDVANSRIYHLILLFLSLWGLAVCGVSLIWGSSLNVWFEFSS